MRVFGRWLGQHEYVSQCCTNVEFGFLPVCPTRLTRRRPVALRAAITVAMAFTMMALFSMPAWAEQARFQSKLSIVSPLKLSQSRDLDFGAMRLAPGEACTLDPSTGQTHGGACYASDGQSARIVVEGTTMESVGIEVVVEDNSTMAFAPEIRRMPGSAAASQSQHFVLDIGGTVSLNEVPHLDVAAKTGVDYPAMTLAYAVEIVYP